MWSENINKHKNQKWVHLSSKILNTFLFLFAKNVGFKAGIHKMLVRKANRDYPDQTAS